MRDVYLVLGDLPEDPKSRETADGRAATKADACRRLARMVCADETQFGWEDAQQLARSVGRRAGRPHRAGLGPSRLAAPGPARRDRVVRARRFSAAPRVSGVGLDRSIISLAEQLSASVSRAATAYALAVLTQVRSFGEGGRL